MPISLGRRYCLDMSGPTTNRMQRRLKSIAITNRLSTQILETSIQVEVLSREEGVFSFASKSKAERIKRCQ